MLTAIASFFPYRCTSSVLIAGGTDVGLSWCEEESNGGDEEEEGGDPLCAWNTASHCRTASATSSAFVMAEMTAMLSAPASKTWCVFSAQGKRARTFFCE